MTDDEVKEELEIEQVLRCSDGKCSHVPQFDDNLCHGSQVLAAAYRAEKALRELYDKKLHHNRCHRGHETLPLKLWDCPACHEETQKVVAAARKDIADHEDGSAGVCEAGGMGKTHDALKRYDAHINNAPKRKR